MRTIEDGDDGALHEFWHLSEEEIKALASFAGERDPGAGQREKEARS